MVLVAILWAICFPFITVGLPDAPPLLFASIRASLAGACLIAIGMRMERGFHCSFRRLMMLTLIGFSLNRPQYSRHSPDSGNDAFRTRPVTGHHSCRAGALGYKTSQCN